MSVNTLPSLPSLRADNILDATLATHDRFINKGPGTTRMEEQQFANGGSGTTRNDNEDWTTCTSSASQRRRWGRLDEDVPRSERGTKRKASNDAPEKTRKKQETPLSNVSTSDYLSQSVSEQSVSVPVTSSSSTSDARYVGFKSSQEVTQPQGEDHAYLVSLHPLDHFLSDGLTGSPRLISSRDVSQLNQAVTQEDQHCFYDETPTPQEEYFEEYPNPYERFANMSDIPRIPTWQPRAWGNLYHDLIFQHGYGESFDVHPSQFHHDLSESCLTPCLENQFERLAEICLIKLIL